MYNKLYRPGVKYDHPHMRDPILKFKRQLIFMYGDKNYAVKMNIINV